MRFVSLKQLGTPNMKRQPGNQFGIYQLIFLTTVCAGLAIPFRIERYRFVASLLSFLIAGTMFVGWGIGRSIREKQNRIRDSRRELIDEQRTRQEKSPEPEDE